MRTTAHSTAAQRDRRNTQADATKFSAVRAFGWRQAIQAGTATSRSWAAPSPENTVQLNSLLAIPFVVLFSDIFLDLTSLNIGEIHGPYSICISKNGLAF